MKILDIVSSEENYVNNIDYYLENEIEFLRWPEVGSNFIFVHKGKINSAGKIAKIYIGYDFMYVRTEKGTGFIFYEEVEDEKN